MGRAKQASTEHRKDGRGGMRSRRKEEEGLVPLLPRWGDTFPHQYPHPDWTLDRTYLRGNKREWSPLTRAECRLEAPIHRRTL